MTLDDETCWKLVNSEHHGALATVHEGRGVDAVPVVYALLPGRRIVSPVDSIKPKRHTRLQRLDNIDRDSRCVLLVEHYDRDWKALWWVRVHGEGRQVAPTDAILDALGSRFEEYRADRSVDSVIELAPVAVTGWAANPEAVRASLRDDG